MKPRGQRLLLLSGLALGSFLFLSCGGRQSAVDAAGVQAQHLEDLWWLFFWVCVAVWIIVMAMLLIALSRNKRVDAGTAPDVPGDPARERHAGYAVKGAVAVTLVVLFILMFVSFRAGRAIDTLSQAEGPLHIKVTGQQWWWQVEYVDDAQPSNNVVAGNEIHVPVGRPVRIDLVSHDVIHSFWLPNLHGKKDLIPNYPTTIYFQADRPGIYWGQCAEFCGYEHAKMRFMVVAQSPEEYQSWYETAQRQAASPTTDSQKRGQQIFLTSVCAQCHTISGTTASATVGPNLTHVASKPYIASGSLENTHANLRSWITDPQAIKPGVKMPMNTFSEAELDALISYIESLK
jgi:cytochrome c oxidase subunit II